MGSHSSLDLIIWLKRSDAHTGKAVPFDMLYLYVCMYKIICWNRLQWVRARAPTGPGPKWALAPGSSVSWQFGLPAVQVPDSLGSRECGLPGFQVPGSLGSRE